MMLDRQLRECRREEGAMKRRPKGPKTETKAVPAYKAAKRSARAVKSAKQGRQGGDLEKTLSLIRTHPGIRPSELNRLLNREQSDGLRNTLIKRRLIRKEKDGSAMRYYPV
jgi:hypothetical protein